MTHVQQTGHSAPIGEHAKRLGHTRARVAGIFLRLLCEAPQVLSQRNGHVTHVRQTALSCFNHEAQRDDMRSHARTRA